MPPFNFTCQGDSLVKVSTLYNIYNLKDREVVSFNQCQEILNDFLNESLIYTCAEGATAG